MNKESKVNKISEDSLTAIIAKSPEALPLRPSESGIPPQKIREHFYKYVTDVTSGEKSIVGEINRVVDEQNEINRDLLQFKDSIAGNMDFQTEAKEIVGAVNELHGEADELKKRLFGEDGERILATALPSYVDDVIEYDNYDAFPKTGEKGKIYVDTGTNKSYRWNNGHYVLISSATCVERVENTSENMQVYAESPNKSGGTMLPAVSEPGQGKSIMLRDDEGRAQINYPASDYDIANKKYVGDQRKEIKEESALSFSAAIKGKVSGKIVALDDVSPVEHKVKIGAKSKNLFDIDSAKKLNGGSTFEKIDNSIIVSQSRKGSYISANIALPEEYVGKIITVSADVTTSAENEAQLRVMWLTNSAVTGKYIISERYSGQATKKISLTGVVPDKSNEQQNQLCLMLYSNSNNGGLEEGVTYTATYSNIQIEIGTEVTPYTPFVPDDTEVTIKTCGQNILKYPYTHSNRTHHGITYTDNGDGTITANGTATFDSTFDVSTTGFISNSTDTVSFILSGCPSGGGADTYHLRNVQTGHMDTGSGLITNGIAIKSIGIRILIKAGTKVENLVFKPQLVISNKSLTTSTPIPAYEPYIEGETVTTTIAEGAELTSIAPNMTILTDTQGVEVELEVEYIKDINIVLDKMVLGTMAFEKIYPVDSIYMSLNTTSPAGLFGGTWEKLTNRFLIGAGDSYILGATGGEATHTLTVAEMPAHSHEVKFDNTFSVGSGSGSYGKAGTDCYVNITKGPRSGTLAAVQKGGGIAHNNMPPYIAVNIWRRTA